MTGILEQLIHLGCFLVLTCSAVRRYIVFLRHQALANRLNNNLNNKLLSVSFLPRRNATWIRGWCTQLVVCFPRNYSTIRVVHCKNDCLFPKLCHYLLPPEDIQCALPGRPGCFRVCLWLFCSSSPSNQCKCVL